MINNKTNPNSLKTLNSIFLVNKITILVTEHDYFGLRAKFISKRKIASLNY